MPELPTPPTDPVQLALYTAFFTLAVNAFNQLPADMQGDYSAQASYLIQQMEQLT